MQPFAGLHPSTTRPILTPKLEQRSFCSAQNPASFGVKLAYGVGFAGNPSKEKAWNFSVHQEVSGFVLLKLEIYCSIGFIVGTWQEIALFSSNRLQQRPRFRGIFWRTLQQAPTASTKVVYSFGHSPFSTERDGKRDNGCCSLSNRDKRDVLLCPAERNISVILNLCLTAQAMRFAERSWILSFSLGLLLRIHPLWWKYPHDPWFPEWPSGWFRSRRSECRMCAAGYGS